MRTTISLFLFLLVAMQPLSAQIQLPANMYPDSVHAPFLFGVASGDPLTDRVLLWTKIDPQGQTSPLNLTWEVASDPGFTNVLASGSATADASRDWTVQVDASGLAPATRYYYRFREPGGQHTPVGRTRTAAAGNVERMRIGVASCSSIFSGFFNAYARMGERDDLDLIVHLGDYLYDFVDQDETVRVPTPALPDPATLTEWRYQHEYYLLDPDLRLARQMHPWSVIWDNHDIDGEGIPQQQAAAIQAFHEYVPIRLTNNSQPERIYRKLSFGNLVDLFLLDSESLRDQDTIAGNELSILGDTQWSWLSQEITASSARWRLFANQKMFANFSTAGLSSIVPFGDGPVADSGAWDGYNAARVRLLNHLVQQNQDNNIVLSGDIHMSFACDLAPDMSNYDPQTGTGSVAVEFLPTSITRGNFDEAGFGGFLANLAAAAISLANPHHVYGELLSHGYGILDISPDSAVAEYWYSPILQRSNSENFATGYVCRDGENHWDRNARNNPLTAVKVPARPGIISGPYPNPGREKFSLDVALTYPQSIEISLCELATGRQLSILHAGWTAAQAHYELSVKGLAPGVYGVVVKGEDFWECKKWVVK